MRALVIAAAILAVGALVVTDAAVASAASVGSATGATTTATDAVVDLKLSASDRALRGLSVAGAEFTSIGTPVFDRPATFAYLASRGYTLVRIPFRWEAMQRTLSGPLEPAAIAALHTAVDAAGAAGLAVVLDVHNYARYNGVAYGAAGSFTSADFADLWRRLAIEFAGDGAVAGYGLMNEPRSLPTVDGVSGNLRWQRAQQAALDAIRATGDATCVLVSGYSAGAMGAWLNASTGQPAPYIVDPLDNIRWEAHHYWDAGNTGTYSTTYADAVAAGFGSSQGDALRTRTWFELNQWLNWLKQYGQRGFIGEFGWPSAENGLSASEAAQWQSLATLYLGRIDQEDPALVWTAAWATGSRWSTGYALQFYGSSDGVLSTPLSNAAVLEAFAREVAPAASVPSAPADESAPQVEPAETPATEPTPAGGSTPGVEAAETRSGGEVVAGSTSGGGSTTDGGSPSTGGSTSGGGSTAAGARSAAVLGPRGKTASRTTASAVATRVKRGTRPRIRVRVAASGVRATGAVTVRWRGKVVGRGSVRGASVVIRLTRSLPVGAQNVVVSYAGSSTVAPSADRTTRVRVTR